MTKMSIEKQILVLVIDCFNNHYKENHHDSSRINIGDRLFWIYIREQPGEKNMIL